MPEMTSAKLVTQPSWVLLAEATREGDDFVRLRVWRIELPDPEENLPGRRVPPDQFLVVSQWEAADGLSVYDKEVALNELEATREALKTVSDWLEA